MAFCFIDIVSPNKPCIFGGVLNAPLYSYAPHKIGGGIFGIFGLDILLYSAWERIYRYVSTIYFARKCYYISMCLQDRFFS